MSLNNVNTSRLVFIIEEQCVLCEVGTEFTSIFIMMGVLAGHRGGPDSILGQSMWDFW